MLAVTINKFLENPISKFINNDLSVPDLTLKIRSIIEDQSQKLPTQILFSNLMSKFFSNGAELINYLDPKDKEFKDQIRYKLSGLVILDCLLDVNDEIMPERRIEISKCLCKILENDKILLSSHEIILRSASASIGHFARVASANEKDFIQNYCLPLAERLIKFSKTDRLRFAGVLVLTQLAQNFPVSIYAKRKQFFDVIWDIVNDKNPIVRLAASTAFEATLQVTSQRESISEYIKAALLQVNTGFDSGVAEKIIGSILILNVIVGGGIISISDLLNTMKAYGIQVQEIIWKVLSRKDFPNVDVRQRVIEILPCLASAFTNSFLQPNAYSGSFTYLSITIKYFNDTLVSKKEREVVFKSLERLLRSLSIHFKTTSNLSEVLKLICLGFEDPFSRQSLNCLGYLVSISPSSRKFVDTSVIDLMFKGGICIELIENLKILIKQVLSVRLYSLKLLQDHIISVLNRHIVFIDENKPQYPIFFQKDNRSTISTFFSGIRPDHQNFDNENFRQEDELVFALQILSAPEFFPKPLRDRSGDDEQTFYLLKVIRESVVRFLDDYNENIRRAATQACAAVLDNVFLSTELNPNQIFILHQILDRLLILGVGDESQAIRVLVFQSLTPTLDIAISQTENVHCLLEALNDENLAVRAAAMTVLARIAHYDSLRVMPIVRLALKRLIFTLENVNDKNIKRDNAQILLALVRGSNSLIIPYAKQVLLPLMTLSNDLNADVVISALSTIGELAVASPISVREHLDELAPRLISALNDQSSVAKQEAAVVALGKLISSFSMVTEEPYKKYSGLFEGLVKAIQNAEESSSELRLQAIKTLGLLGAVDPIVYQKHLLNINAVLNESVFTPDFDSEDEDIGKINRDNKDFSGEKKLSKIEKLYLAVVIRELVKILKDSSLSHLYPVVSSIIIKIIKIIGNQSIPQLNEILNGIFYLLYQSDTANNIKETLLDNIVTLIQILGRNMRSHTNQLISLIKDFFDSHLKSCLDLIEALSISFPISDFNTVLLNILPFLCKIIDDESSPGDVMVINENSSENNIGTSNLIKSSSVHLVSGSSRTLSNNIHNKISKILQIFVNISDSLGEFKRDLIPFIIKVIDSSSFLEDIRKDALCTLMSISNDQELQEFSGRIIQTLLKVININDTLLLSAIFTALSLFVCRLGTGFVPFIIPIRRKISFLKEHNFKSSKLEDYESLVSRLLKLKPLPIEPIDFSDVDIRADEKIRQRGATWKAPIETTFQISLSSLETEWALADKGNSANFVDWMGRFSTELIRQSPSPILRLCHSLSAKYKQIAEELFNLTFYSIWDDLYSSNINDVVINIPLINGIEMALQSPQLPKNIMISLLNLAEFMEAQDRPIPIDVRILAQRAQTANMFAKCLRFREIEFNSRNIPPSMECIDSLITVNNQLGLSDRAIGVLRCLKQQYPHMEIQPQWLEKLCRWDEARKAYEDLIASYREKYPGESPLKDEMWLNSELGRLRCLHSLGEYEELELRAKHLKELITKSIDSSPDFSTNSLSEIQRLGANAAWMLGKWETMEDFMDGDTKSNELKDVVLNHNLSYYQTVFAIHNHEFARAKEIITETRTSLSSTISSLLSESYSRAYKAMIAMQILAEMEEIIEYKESVEKIKLDMEAIKNNLTNESIEVYESEYNIHMTEKMSPYAADLVNKKANVIQKWRERLKWAPKDIEVYRGILAVHTLIADPKEDLDSWLELVTLCRKEGMFSLCSNVLRKLGAPLPPKRLSSQWNFDSPEETIPEIISKANDRVLYSTYQFWWSNGEREKALEELTNFLKTCSLPGSASVGIQSVKESTMFRVKCLLKRATWMRELSKGDVGEILQNLAEARELAPSEYSVWHAWAVANYDQLKKADIDESNSNPTVFTTSTAFMSPPAISNSKNLESFISPQHNVPHKYNDMVNRYNTINQTPRRLNNYSSGAASLLNLKNIQQSDKVNYVTEAIKGFVRSIVLGDGQPVANLLQDTLRLITLWFSYGTKKGVLSILEMELDRVSSDTWLSVIPQLIARIHIKAPEISNLLKKILTKVAGVHPQALVWPISVVLNTNDNQQKIVATEILMEMRKNKKQLVEEATLVSRELMKVAITPHELWYDGLEQAAQSYLDSKDIQTMIKVLKELHETLNDNLTNDILNSKKAESMVDGLGKIGSSSLRDVSFRQNYGKLLNDAHFWLDQFRSTGRTVDLHQAWEVYQNIFKKVKIQIAALDKLELHHVSTALTMAKSLSLAVPGTYVAGVPDICINSFSPSIQVISSKQRPRRIAIFGSDGLKYQFLLKGHEDLRQDERVMQLFGLINACLGNDRMTNHRRLNIVRYSVLPLSNNSGVIGWVENCDTMNQLVKQYREMNDIRLKIELKLLQSKAINYDKLPLLHKVDIFSQVLKETSGEDLAKMLWLKSKTSDVWVERRGNFIKSLAVTSMVGYILGLGDRHPSNLMLHRISGQVVHIDFGDCFEITANRSKYPEIIPFRLTRMLVNCMEAAGVQGTYRLTCERVMRVLRENRDSVMAMLEAFVYDPLISWRLLKNEENDISIRSESGEIGISQRSPVEKLRDQLNVTGHLEVSDILSGVNSSNNLQSEVSPKRSSAISSSLLDGGTLRRTKSQDIKEDEPLQENLNARALEVINRIQAKLTGRDFLKDDDEEDCFTVEQQVDRLIMEATSIENLCQLFTGWCPWW